MDIWRSKYGKVDHLFDDNFNKYGLGIGNFIMDIIMDESYNFSKDQLIEYILNLLCLDNDNNN